MQERPRLEGHLRTTHSRQAAEEIADEAFARIEDGAEPAQLWATAFNVEREHARRVVRDVRLEEQVGLLNGRAIPNIEDAIMRADFDRAFRTLPRPEAEAFALVELRGLTQMEAAEVLGVSQPTVHRRCEAARTQLQKELS